MVESMRNQSTPLHQLIHPGQRSRLIGIATTVEHLDTSAFGEGDQLDPRYGRTVRCHAGVLPCVIRDFDR
jgi:hypothetical protein